MDPGEVRHLRGALRDLVALSTIPAAWVGSEPAIIAAGLADALVGWLRLDFAFVRLREPAGGAAVDAERGSGWDGFSAWLRQHLDEADRGWRKVVVPDVGGGAARRAGLVVPIGVNADGGLVAVASDRADFPSETDQLLLSAAANHAAMAFRGSRLIQELRSAEAELRQARDGLETKVTERTGELRRTSAELQAILDASPIGIVVLGRDHTVQHCNPAFERILGWRAEEVVGQRLPLPREIEQILAALAALPHAERESMRLQTRIPRKDRSELDAALAWAPLSDEHGQPAGLLVNIEDTSDRKRAEEALRQARAELAHVTRLTTLGELAASIAHEVNQPLAAIVADAAASLNWLAKPRPDLGRVREALADIVADGHRAGEVVQRMRQLASKSDPRKVRLDLNDVIHEVVVLARSEVHKHRASLRLALAPALPPVLGDRVLLQQVILNLVMNGVEAMAGVEDRSRELLIRSEPQDAAGVMVSIQDAGVGLDGIEPNRLFEPFFTTKPTGMGMGLSISRTIVEGHDGRLWATANPEHGATFRFALPAARDQRPAVPGPG